MKIIDVDENFIKLIKNINWFSKIGEDQVYDKLYSEDKKIIPHLIKAGKKIEPIMIKPVLHYGECIQFLKSITWENAILEWRNILSMYLSETCPREYQQWNDIATQANKYFNNNIEPYIDVSWAFPEDTDTIIMNLRWQILGIILEHAFRKCKRQGFFSNAILPLVLDGHFPCGWIGELPSYSADIYPKEWKNNLNGTLIVY